VVSRARFERPAAASGAQMVLSLCPHNAHPSERDTPMGLAGPASLQARALDPRQAALLFAPNRRRSD
jgi:hypothetical protein